MSKIVTRFAPSPTGFLHIGGARTALFNWLYARHCGGEFKLRIEDTDAARNNEATIQPIIDGMKWLGLDHDGDIVYQSTRADRHVEIANELIARGAAYRCYMSDDDVAIAKAGFRKAGRGFRSTDRDGGVSKDAPFTVRFRVPDDGLIVIDDLVQGAVTVNSDTLDDMILLRADGTPTYMLAVVVDDHDMGVNTVIRGDDHLNNAFRQLGIIHALDWPVPAYAHIPLIHDEAGKKLSKRHGAAGLEHYRDDLGILPDPMFNYLLRMGWGHGDHEIISRDEAVRLFDLASVGKAPSRLDPKRLEYLSGVYIRDMPEDQLFRAIIEHGLEANDPRFIDRMIPLVKERSKTLKEAIAYIDMAWREPEVTVEEGKAYVEKYLAGIDQLLIADERNVHHSDELKAIADRIADDDGVKLKHVVAPIRMAVMGAKVSPPLFETMAILGVLKSRDRMRRAIQTH